MNKHPGNDNRSAIRVFLDLDGVIADFDTHATTEGKIKPDGKVDYEALDFKWWSTMPVFSGARAFHDELSKIAAVRFLTGPMLNPDCHAGKADWIMRKFLPERGKWALNDLIICPASDKQLMAGPGRILIDDRIGNIQEWEAAGGIGVHHKGDFKDTLARVKQAIAAISPVARPQPKPGLN